MMQISFGDRIHVWDRIHVFEACCGNSFMGVKASYEVKSASEG